MPTIKIDRGLVIVTSFCLLLACIVCWLLLTTGNVIPTVAIASYGPHASLQETIRGLQEGIREDGFTEGKNVNFKLVDANFDPMLIPQMLAQLKATHPKVVVALTTPVAQAAKQTIKGVPIVFSAVTDPTVAGLLGPKGAPLTRLTGVSDRQNLAAVIRWVKRLLPDAKRIGVLYATSEANDHALIQMLEAAAEKYGMSVLAVPVEEAKDVPLRMQKFKGKVDFIYVGVSGPIQPSLPAIAAEADRMHIPVFNADADAVKKHLVLGSLGVSYYQVGLNTAKVVGRILRGNPPSFIAPIYPRLEDHEGFISRKKAQKLGITLPENLEGAIIVD